MSSKFSITEDLEVKNMRKLKVTDDDIYKILKKEKNCPFLSAKTLFKEREREREKYSMNYPDDFTLCSYQDK